MRIPEVVSRHGVIIVFAAAVVLVLACLPVARHFDRQVDSKRPMYLDRLDVAKLQGENIKQHGDPVPLTVSSGESVSIAGSDYSPSSGVTITVKALDDGFCIRANNSIGDDIGWRCWTGGAVPDGSPDTTL